MSELVQDLVTALCLPVLFICGWLLRGVVADDDAKGKREEAKGTETDVSLSSVRGLDPAIDQILPALQKQASHNREMQAMLRCATRDERRRGWFISESALVMANIDFELGDAVEVDPDLGPIAKWVRERAEA